MGSWRPSAVFSLGLVVLAALLILASKGRMPSTLAWISGDSMGPNLKGVHLRLSCQDCGFPIECGLQYPPDRGMVVCPNCGFRENVAGDKPLQQPDTVRVVPLVFAGPIERFDLVAFTLPGAEEMAVKRVIGLPGETIAISQGDVFIDRQRLAKSSRVFDAMSLPVHDVRFRPASDRECSRWITTPDFKPLGFNDGQTALRRPVIYRHRPISAIDAGGDSRFGAAVPAVYTPIRDFDAYNQSLSRQLATVHDCQLSGSFRLNSGKTLSLKLLYAADETAELVLSSERAIIRWRDNKIGLRGGRNRMAAETWHAFAFGWVDGRLLIRVDDARQAVEIDIGESAAISPRFYLSGSGVELRNLSIDRDVYYLHPHRTLADWALDRPLADDEYFVLGDNSPASIDSRQWNQGIKLNQIRGKVFVSD